MIIVLEKQYSVFLRVAVLHRFYCNCTKRIELDTDAFAVAIIPKYSGWPNLNETLLFWLNMVDELINSLHDG